MGFLLVFDYSGKKLQTSIYNTTKRNGIDLSKRGKQDYNESNVISSAYRDIQVFIKKQAPNTNYGYCVSHIINLILNNAINVLLMCQINRFLIVSKKYVKLLLKTYVLLNGFKKTTLKE